MSDNDKKSAPSGRKGEAYGYNMIRMEEELKVEQKRKVKAFIEEKGFIPSDKIDAEIDWFYVHLGITDLYFKKHDPDDIAAHIMTLYGAKILAYTRSENEEEIYLRHKTESGALFMHSSKPGEKGGRAGNTEKIIDSNYLDHSNGECYRIETYRSVGTVSSTSQTRIRCYFISKCEFPKKAVDSMETDMDLISDIAFRGTATSHTLSVYQEAIKGVVTSGGPIISLVTYPDESVRRLVIGFRRGTTSSFFSALSDLYHFYGMHSTGKFVEQFANGVTVMSLYLRMAKKDKGFGIDEAIKGITKGVSMLYCLPTNWIVPFFEKKEVELSIEEISYTYCVYLFSIHHIERLSKEYFVLAKLHDEKHSEAIEKIKKRLYSSTLRSEYILNVLSEYPHLVRECFLSFASEHAPAKLRQSSVQNVLSPSQLSEKIRLSVANDEEMKVFRILLIFNKHVLKTNFFLSSKLAIAFRLDPGFLSPFEYPQKLFGMFFVVGAEFHGFHLRVKDVARGGIRVIRSRDKETYRRNLGSLFAENYYLAQTQQKKNKDIPEGGSKGTILLQVKYGDKTFLAFKKYVDSILDVVLPSSVAKLVDKYGKEEILFFGPDEGTAKFMDWASQHSRSRGYKTWKAFTTGKSRSLGGIPHDLYGMTTRSVHQYVLGIYKKMGLKEEEVTKVQTGGPDGDLGGNEIKISSDKTIAIVDGSGVLYDPHGIDRKTLLGLVENHQMIEHFDKSKLSKDGFKILLEDRNVSLPNGKCIENGTIFRNTFHLSEYAKSIIFVPCGGRPEAVDINNVQQLFESDGVTPKFSYIVEGANLFFTQQARMKLEKANVIIFKDASANKGGVTSSSLEVLSALALSDEEFEKNMMVKDGKEPEFYCRYIKDVHKKIEENAALEFEAIWREHEETGIMYSVLTSKISQSILDLAEEFKTSLWDMSLDFRKKILSEAIPRSLQELVPLDTIIERVPESYLKALFSSHLASRFVYQKDTTIKKLFSVLVDSFHL